MRWLRDQRTDAYRTGKNQLPSVDPEKADPDVSRSGLHLNGRSVAGASPKSGPTSDKEWILTIHRTRIAESKLPHRRPERRSVGGELWRL